MDKNLKIIVIIGVIIILVFLGLIINEVLKDTTHEEHVINEDGTETIYIIDDYVISQSTNIYVDANAALGDNSRILAVLGSINTQDNEVVSLNVSDNDGTTYELQISDMKLIDINYNGVDEVNITYRTGGYARGIVGSYLYLYKTADGSYSLDERSQYGGEYEMLTGSVIDFEFTPMEHQNGHIMLSYVILNANGQQIKLALNTMSIHSILSSGEMTVYYVGDTATNNIYNVRAEDNFSAAITMQDGSVINFAKGTQISLEKSSLKGYWELNKNIDTSRVQASVVDIEFDFEGTNITGINYIVLSLGDGTQVKMPMLHTGAMHGTPSGNYERSYSSDGTDMVISDVTPASDWKMELNYADGTALELKIGSGVWIHKNADGIYVLDYEYTSQN